MVSRAEKKDSLKTRLIEAAKTRIISGGLEGLRARDITNDAGCALGALYTAFADLDALVIEVNSLTLREIDRAMLAALENIDAPSAQMQVLAATYLGFARTHERRWRTLFDLKIPDGKTVPDWYMADQALLLMRIVGPLRLLQREFTEAELMIRARTLFAAVHGIVTISLDRRFVGIASDTLDAELQRFIGLLLKGLGTDQTQFV
jgi:AcrR family transcriptional regulator